MSISSSRVLECLAAIIVLDGANKEIESPAACKRLYDLHPEAKDFIKQAGGIRKFCDSNSKVLYFVESDDGGAGSIRLSASETKVGAKHQNLSPPKAPSTVSIKHADTVCDCAVEILRSDNSLEQSCSALAAVLYKRLLGSKDIIQNDFKGMRNFCEAYKSKLEYLPSTSDKGGGDRVRLADVPAMQGAKGVDSASMEVTKSKLSKKSMDETKSELSKKAKNCIKCEAELDVHTITGKLIRAVKQKGAYMESSPGISDVFIGQDVWDGRDMPRLAKMGTKLSVAAVEHVTSTCKWKAVHILHVSADSSHSVTDLPGVDTKERAASTADSKDVHIKRRAAGTAYSKDVDTRRRAAGTADSKTGAAGRLADTLITGKVTRVMPGFAFMESSLGVSDVFVSASLFSGRTLECGETLSVLVFRHDTDTCEWRATKILQNATEMARVGQDIKVLTVEQKHSMKKGKKQSQFKKVVRSQLVQGSQDMQMNRREFTGKVVGLLPSMSGVCMESEPGAKDIIVSNRLLGGRSLQVGDELSVSAKRLTTTFNSYQWLADRVLGQNGAQELAASTGNDDYSVEKMASMLLEDDSGRHASSSGEDFDTDSGA